MRYGVVIEIRRFAECEEDRRDIAENGETVARPLKVGDFPTIEQATKAVDEITGGKTNG